MGPGPLDQILLLITTVRVYCCTRILLYAKMLKFLFCGALIIDSISVGGEGPGPLPPSPLGYAYDSMSTLTPLSKVEMFLDLWK